MEHENLNTEETANGDLGAVSGSAFAVYPDSIRYGLSDKNELMAVFRLEKQARIFGARMWGKFYIVKPIVSEHFR